MGGLLRVSRGCVDPSLGSKYAYPTLKARHPLIPLAAYFGDYRFSHPLGSFVEIVRRTVFRPAGFFAGIPRRGNFVGLLLFALICLEVSAVLGELIGMGPDHSSGAFVGWVVFTPNVGIITPFTGTGRRLAPAGQADCGSRELGL